METKPLILRVLEIAREHFSRQELADLLGIHVNQLTNACAGRCALPFAAALKLAELLQVEPLPLLCANESLMEKNEAKKTYLEQFFDPTEEPRIICDYVNQNHTNMRARITQICFVVNKQMKKNCLQGADYVGERRLTNTRQVEGFKRKLLNDCSAWVLRPRPSFPNYTPAAEPPRTPDGWKKKRLTTA